jgi:hypothetical protein
MVLARKFATILLAISGLQSVAAKADVVVPDGFFLAQLATNYPTPSNPRHFQDGTFAPVDNTLTLNTGLTFGQINSVVSTHPGFNATASVNGPGGQMIAMGSGGYYFAITSAVNAQARILLAGSGAVSESITTPNSVSVTFNGPGIGSVTLGQACSSSATTCSGVSDSFSFSTPFLIDTNKVYNFQFNLHVVAQTAGLGVTTDSQWGFVDPFISFDPAFGDGSGFQLLLSNNLGNLPIASAVPEPSTWAMMILGFAGVGFMAYRRSRKDQGLALAAA